MACFTTLHPFPNVSNCSALSHHLCFYAFTVVAILVWVLIRALQSYKFCATSASCYAWATGSTVIVTFIDLYILIKQQQHENIGNEIKKRSFRRFLSVFKVNNPLKYIILFFYYTVISFFLSWYRKNSARFCFLFWILAWSPKQFAIHSFLLFYTLLLACRHRPTTDNCNKAWWWYSFIWCFQPAFLGCNAHKTDV